VSAEFTKAFNGIDAAIKQGTARALNRALSSTRTKVTRAIREQTGLKTAVIKTRIREAKANRNKLSVVLALATKVGVSLAEFAPRVKKVMSAAGKRFGVTVKIGQQARQLVPGGWLATVKSGKQLVLARKGKAQYPTVALRTTVFTDVVKAEQASAKRYIVDEFDRIVAEYIDFEIQKKFAQDK
jgi:hypothetical protein